MVRGGAVGAATRRQPVAASGAAVGFALAWWTRFRFCTGVAGAAACGLRCRLAQLLLVTLRAHWSALALLVACACPAVGLPVANCSGVGRCKCALLRSLLVGRGSSLGARRGFVCWAPPPSPPFLSARPAPAPGFPFAVPAARWPCAARFACALLSRRSRLAPCASCLPFAQRLGSPACLCRSCQLLCRGGRPIVLARARAGLRLPYRPCCGSRCSLFCFALGGTVLHAVEGCV